MGFHDDSKWVGNGMTFYLQDVSGGKTLTAANTLATVGGLTCGRADRKDPPNLLQMIEIMARHVVGQVSDARGPSLRMNASPVPVLGKSVTKASARSNLKCPENAQQLVRVTLRVPAQPRPYLLIKAGDKAKSSRSSAGSARRWRSHRPASARRPR